MIDILTPQYDIIPHGVTKRDHLMYMRFKMVVTFKEFEKSGIINDKIWNNTADLINKMEWGYNINSFTINFKAYVEKDGDQPILFDFDNTKKSAFCFGERTPGKSAFQFLKQGFTIRDPERDASVVSQMEPVPEDKSKLVGSKKGDYSKMLNNAREFDNSEKHKFEAAITDTKDFTGVYAAIIDDYEIAEKGFGVVRTFYIPIQKISDTVDVEGLVNNLYAIRIMGDFVDARYLLQKKPVQNIDKYYHGLSSKYFTQGDFEYTEVLKWDPYKENLVIDPENKRREKIHPDGAYMMVIYKEDSSRNIVDPFVKEGIKGFNVVVKQAEYHSLSYHQTSVTLKNTNLSPFINFGSGILSPRTSLHVKEDNREKSKRSNILFAWRGDNLLVNRLNTNGGDTKGTLVPKDFKGEETKFVKSDLFEKDHKLVSGTQIQLNADKTYQFFIRKVSVSGYYIPLKREIEHLPAEVQAYTLTLQDDVASADQFGGDFKFVPQDLPIKAVTIIGTKKYKKQDIEFVDQHQQMVLDLTKETKERRFVYPSQIKLEDLKFLSYLTPERLITRSGEKPSRKQLAQRCIELEKKINRKPREYADSMYSVPYLVDPRAKNLFLSGSDYFTATKLNAQLKTVFKIDEYYPFFDKTKSVELLLENKGNESSLKIYPNGGGGEIVWPSIKKGIYNLSVYITDQELTEKNIDLFAPIPFKISVLGLPDKPLITNQSSLNTEKEVTRNILFPNYWFEELKHKGATDGWKSLKYLEKSKILKLEQDRLDEKLVSYYKDESIKEMELFTNEYPYDMFLADEGGFNEENGLKTSIYPNHIKIECNPKDIQGNLFSWKLNDEETLTVTVNDAKKVVFSVGDKSLVTDNGSILISFDPTINQYLVKGNGTVNTIPLKKYVYQELSIRDIHVEEQVFKKVRINNGDLIKVDDIKSFIFIDDNKNPYHQNKEILFYSSSMFQAYYPLKKSEFTLGTKADKTINIEIPNNVKPEPPLVKYEKLIKNTTNQTWVTDAKEGRTESLVKLILQPDFMKEGKNRLGIVLAGAAIKDGKNQNVSMVGEDITKLTIDPNLSELTVADIINNQKSAALLSKYIAPDAIKYYEIDNIIYTVLECIPFYDSKDKQWQVVLSFDLKQTETMFMKLVMLKIADGHGLSTRDNNSSSPKNGLVDTTGTNLSIFSAPCEFPIYAKKRTVVKRTSTTFNISFESVSKYKDKVYFVMLLKPNASKDILNFDGSSQIEKFPSLLPFAYYTATPSTLSKEGKVLQLNGVPNIVISRKICESIVVLEFELHKNHNLKLTNAVDFVELNPLFENKGIRLINAVEFKY